MKKLFLLVLGIINFNSVGAAVQEIDISELKFAPAVVDINQGDTVRWINRDSVDHKIQGSFGTSSTLSTNQTYEFVFNQAGNFDYISTLHSSVTGTIRVASVTTLSGMTNTGSVSFSDLFGTGDNFEPEDLTQTFDAPQIEATLAEEVLSVAVPQATQIPTPVVNTRTFNQAPPVRAEARSAMGNQRLPTTGASDWLSYLLVLSLLGGVIYLISVSRR